MIFKPANSVFNRPAKIKAADFDRMMASLKEPRKVPDEVRIRLAAAGKLIKKPS